jgi:histidinol-phosphatase (PHP family)
MFIPHDYHMHSTFSPDGKSTPEEMCRRAIELGIPEIGFTEHHDFNPLDKNPGRLQSDAWLAELQRLRSLFSGQLTIRAGIEISEPHLFPDQTAGLLERVPFDFVIGSLHFLGGHFLFDEKFYRQTPADGVFRAFFTELELMTRSPVFDILGHLDLPVRTSKPIYGGYDPARYEEYIRPVLQNVIAHNLALDVNAGGLRKPSQNLMPDPLILKWYAEMGGQCVTLGSDAHNAGQVGLNLETAIQAIRAAGLTHVAQFEQRQAQLLPIS